MGQLDETGGARLVRGREDQQAQVRRGLDRVGSVFERDVADIGVRQGVNAFGATGDLGATPVTLEIRARRAELLDEAVECRVIG